MKRKGLFTSESVGKGHPDKICDQISDKILDELLRQDPNSRVAVETMATNKLIIVGGEITTKGYVDTIKTTWEVLEQLGYKENSFNITTNIHNQSSDIKMGVDHENKETGAGDQGLIFGYATNETKELMPLPIMIAHSLVKEATRLIDSGEMKWAKYDMKSQVTIDYNNEPRIHTILMSVQHSEDYNKSEFHDFIKKEIMFKIAKKYNLNTDFKIIINPTGNFVIGGPVGDTGLTGRKIIVDTYGGMARHGGGAFSGKDYTKVDRSGAYMARWIAKNLVASGIADEMEIQLSYAIGINKPISIAIETFDSSKYSEIKIIEIIENVFDLSIDGMIKSLELKKPQYYQTSYFGHFGREDLNLPWEKLNKVKEIKNYL